MENKPIDLRMELTKKELVDSINEISNKYSIPVCLLNIILSGISIEVNRVSQMELEKNMRGYLEEQQKENKKQDE